MSRNQMRSVVAWGVAIPALSLGLLGCDNPLPRRLADAGAVELDAGAPRDASELPAVDSGTAVRDSGAGPVAGSGGAGQGAAGAAGNARAPTVAPEIERATVAAEALPEITDEDYSEVIQQLNKFGLELGRRHVEVNNLTERNSIYSPLSAAVALSMTYAGARTDTAAEMNEVLAGGIAADVYHKGVNRLTRELMSRAQRITANGTTRRIELSLADALYVDKSLAVEDTFLEQLARNYDTGVYREDFLNAPEQARAKINGWVADMTHERITDLIPQAKIKPTTRFVIVNALYFYGSWAFPFEQSQTRDADFHALDGSTVMVPTMHQQESMSYAAGSGFVAVDLPYLGHALRMAIVLPEEGQFDAVRKGLSAAWLETTLSSMTNARIQLSLPKFKMTSESFLLNSALIDMGLASAFNNADLTGITQAERLRIVDVVQKAFIAVDEYGTEAAAATAVIGGFSAPTGEIIELIIDRPFLFVIHDNSGAVLFSGHVVNPANP